VRPDLAEPSPPWRHAVFAAVNLSAAAGALFRPRGFVLAFALLTAQQLYSHGTYAADVWRDERRIDWASVVVLAGMPVALALFVADARARRASQAPVKLPDTPP
jgi:hypothetical protein